ncbi:MAG: STAS/SEC14 domain-containing protein [Gammaproteobacteria bacterium]
MLVPFKKESQTQGMDFELLTHPEHELLEVRVYGVIDVEQFLEMIDIVINEIKKHGFKRVLYVNRDADSSKISTRDLKRVVSATEQMNDVISGGSLVAVMYNKLNYGLARMWFTLSGAELNYSFQLFNNRDDAMAWLATH